MRCKITLSNFFEKKICKKSIFLTRYDYKSKVEIAKKGTKIEIRLFETEKD